MSVKRYEWMACDEHACHCDVVESAEGDMVDYEDYAALEARCAALAAEKALPAMKRLLMMPNDELFDEVLLNVDGDVDAANAFNLLAGPETILTLLDELEAAEKRIAELEALEVVVNIKPPTIGRAYSMLNHVWTEQEVRKACELAGIKLNIAAAGKGE